MIKIAVIPSFEPDENLINVVEELFINKYEIIVVDDGSGKKYKEIYDKIKEKAKIISYQNNQGKGYALKRAFKFIKEN